MTESLFRYKQKIGPKKFEEWLMAHPQYNFAQESVEETEKRNNEHYSRTTESSTI